MTFDLEEGSSADNEISAADDEILSPEFGSSSECPSLFFDFEYIGLMVSSPEDISSVDEEVLLVAGDRAEEFIMSAGAE